MAIFLGIDGGGTKTLCLIGDEHSILGRGSGAGSNVIRVGEARAESALREAISQACQEASVDPAQITRTYVGAAGADQSTIAESVRRIVTQIIGTGKVKVVGDVLITLRAAFGREPGIVVVAGTGSVAYGRNASGNVARSGGWGFAVGDEGSGHWIGRSAVAAIFRAADEANEADEAYENDISGKLLLKAILKTWSLEGLDELVLAANASPTPSFAEIFPAVLAASNAGDQLACNVLKHAGLELASLVKLTANKLFPNATSIPVAMSGGVFRTSPMVREFFYNELQRDYPNIKVNLEIIDPVHGALDLARNCD